MSARLLIQTLISCELDKLERLAQRRRDGEALAPPFADLSPEQVVAHFRAMMFEESAT